MLRLFTWVLPAGSIDGRSFQAEMCPLLSSSLQTFVCRSLLRVTKTAFPSAVKERSFMSEVTNGSGLAFPEREHSQASALRSRVRSIDPSGDNRTAVIPSGVTGLGDEPAIDWT